MPNTDQPGLSRPSPRIARLIGLRADLFGPIDLVISLTQTLCDSVGDRVLSKLLPDLQSIRSAALHLRNMVDERLDPTRVGSASDAPTHFRQLRHDLRTPLNHVLGYAQLLMEDAEQLRDRQLLADLQRIHAAGRRALTLVDEVVDLAQGDGSINQPGSDSDATRSHSSLAPLTGDHHGCVLVVDDDEANRDVLCRRLHRRGYDTLTAASGNEALVKLRENDVDVVLLDVVMNGMSGAELLRTIRADGRLRDLPVLMISAMDEIETVVECIQLGAEDYLAKPFDPVLLQARVGACMEKKRMRDQERQYLQDVQQLTAAAAALEQGQFGHDSLTDVSRREDELGRLARVFERMAREVAAREQRLQQQVSELRLEVDEVRKRRQVDEITESDYFQHLQRRVREMRSQREADSA